MVVFLRKEEFGKLKVEKCSSLRVVENGCAGQVDSWQPGADLGSEVCSSQNNAMARVTISRGKKNAATLITLQQV
jgi:hypothetical protein